MTIDDGKSVALAAMAGLMAGLAGCGDKQPAVYPDGGQWAGSAPWAASDKGCCRGRNECMGKGGCKTDSHNCKGMNECAGKGGCAPADCSGASSAAAQYRNEPSQPRYQAPTENRYSQATGAVRVDLNREFERPKQSVAARLRDVDYREDTLCPESGASGSVSYKPPLLPIKVSLTSDGDLSISASRSVVTPLGTFEAEGNAPLIEGARNNEFMVRVLDRSRNMQAAWFICGETVLTMTIEGTTRFRISAHEVLIEID